MRVLGFRGLGFRGLGFQGLGCGFIGQYKVPLTGLYWDYTAYRVQGFLPYLGLIGQYEVVPITGCPARTP